MTNKVAVVSGGGTGIGRAVCKRLAADGYTVVVGYSRSVAGADSVVADITAAGGSALAQKVNIAVEEEVINLFRVTRDTFGRVDIVVNNAGIGHMKAFEQISMEEYDYIFNTNTRGTFMMCREAARVVEDNGRIINISTGATRTIMNGQSLYTASKLAVEGFSKVLAKELGSRGIAVNVVSPGMTDTPMLEGGDAAALREYGARVAAMKRCGTAQDIADAVAALVSEDCRWISGQNIPVCGGSNIV